jgi:hypothetical protein
MDKIDLVLFRLFTTACMAGGLLLIWYGLFCLLMAAIERTLAVSSCVEAAIEAHSQGRAPLFRAWRGINAWMRG